MTVFVMVAYLLIVIMIGVYVQGRVKSEDDYLAAGGNVGAVVGGAALAGAQMSVGTAIGSVGFHNQIGYNFIWVWLFLWAGWVLNAFFIAPKMKNYYDSHGALTIPDLLGERYESNVVRVLSAIVLLIGFGMTIVAELVGIGYVFQTTMGISPAVTIILTAIIFIVYTMAGGMFAVVYTNLFQMGVFLLGFVIAAITILTKTGGFTSMNNQLAAINPALVANGMPVNVMLAAGFSFFFMMVGYPLIAMRFYSLKDKKTIRKSIGIAFILQAIMAICVLIVGVGSRVVFPDLAMADLATPTVATKLLNPLFGGLLLAAVLAASQSTTSGVLLMISSAISHDIIKKIMYPNLSEKTLMKITRISALIVGLLPIPFALRPTPLIQQIWIDAGAVIGSSYAIVMMAGLYWKRANRMGGLLSMLGGFGSSTIWLLLKNPFGLSPIYPGALMAFLGMVLGSMLTEKPSESVLETFFNQEAGL